MQRFIFPLLIFVGLAPWLYLQLQIRPPGDASFLFYGAQQLLNGKTMTDAYFDNNPPMSFLIYIPAVLLYKIGIPKYLALACYTLILTVLSIAATSALLNKIKNISPEFKNTLIFAFTIAITILCSVEYAQKDHLIAIGIIPFMLLQYLITNKIKTALPLELAVLIICTPFILLKPHFGLLPTAMLLRRRYLQKRITIVFDKDFLALAIGTIAYIAYTFFYAPDFIETVLPISLELYITSGALTISTLTKYSLTFLAFCIGLTCLIHIHDHFETKEEKTISLHLAIAASLTILPFYVQGKGFSLHLLPTYTFLFMAFSPLILMHIKKSKKPVITKHALNISIGAIYLATLPFIYLPAHTTNKLLTHKNYCQSSFIKHLQNKTYFVEHTTTSPIYIPQMYTDEFVVASRFPSLWFLKPALELKSEERKKEILNYFGNLIAEDLENKKPEIMILPDIKDGQSPIEIIFKYHEKVQEQLNRYEYQETITLTKSNPLYIDFHVMQNTEKLPVNLKIYKRIN